MNDTSLYIAGTRRERLASLVVTDPWTRSPLARVSEATASDASDAAEAASRAFLQTRRTSRRERSELLEGIAHALQGEAESLARLLSQEVGKPIFYARAEVTRAITTFRLGADVARSFVGEQIPLDVTRGTENVDGYSLRGPRGPVLAISPFNFPLNLVAHKVAPALAVGAPVVLKPAPQAPLVALRLAAIVRSLSPSVDWLQVLPCSVAVAEQLVEDTRFSFVTFTGSDRVGWQIKARAGKKPVCLELGGNAAALIDKNSNWEAAIPQLVASAFGFAGQVCIKTQRILVDEAIAARFEAAFLEAASALRVGNPSAEETRVGPVIDDVAGTRLQRWIGDARAAGANVHHDCVEGAPINRVEPAVVTGPASLLRDLDVSREEVFGPVAVIQQFSSWREGIAEVNRSRYGLQAGVFSDSLSHVHEAITELEVGGVVINDTPSLRLDGMPYGGVKDSGLGREGVRDAAREMTDSKVVLFRR